jgi:predicted DNA binding CopG/RHH family protein
MTKVDRPMKPKEPIPRFASREEEAEFWDTHDLADYWQEFKPVRARFAKNLSKGITIRLDPDTLAELRKQAHARGIGPTTLVRMWIIERLQASKPRRSTVAPS